MINAQRVPGSDQWQFTYYIQDYNEDMVATMQKIGQANTVRAWYDHLLPGFKSTEVYLAYVRLVQALVHSSVQYDLDYNEHFIHVLLNNGMMIVVTESVVELYNKKDG